MPRAADVANELNHEHMGGKVTSTARAIEYFENLQSRAPVKVAVQKSEQAAAKVIQLFPDAMELGTEAEVVTTGLAWSGRMLAALPGLVFGMGVELFDMCFKLDMGLYEWQQQPQTAKPAQASAAAAKPHDEFPDLLNVSAEDEADLFQLACSDDMSREAVALFYLHAHAQIAPTHEVSEGLSLLANRSIDLNTDHPAISDLQRETAPRGQQLLGHWPPMREDLVNLLPPGKCRDLVELNGMLDRTSERLRQMTNQLRHSRMNDQLTSAQFNKMQRAGDALINESDAAVDRSWREGGPTAHLDELIDTIVRWTQQKLFARNSLTGKN